jgi:hypothetical protein
LDESNGHFACRPMCVSACAFLLASRGQLACSSLNICHSENVPNKSCREKSKEHLCPIQFSPMSCCFRDNQINMSEHTTFVTLCTHFLTWYSLLCALCHQTTDIPCRCLVPISCSVVGCHVRTLIMLLWILVDELKVNCVYHNDIIFSL